jgi:hypothetical protein
MRWLLGGLIFAKPRPERLYRTRQTRRSPLELLPISPEFEILSSMSKHSADRDQDRSGVDGGNPPPEAPVNQARLYSRKALIGGALTIGVGVLLSMTIIGAVIGIPLILFGILLCLASPIVGLIFHVKE